MPSSLRDPHAALARLGGAAGLRRGFEAAVVVLLGLQAARLAWLLIPPASLGAVPVQGAWLPEARPERLAIDAFHPGRSGAVAADTSGLRLFAVRPAAGGGSAILAPRDGTQRSHVVGDEVAPGVRLAAVARDHVVLESGAGRSELRFEHAPTAPATPVAAPSTAPAAASAPPLPPAPGDGAGTGATPSIDPAQLIAEMGLRPEEVDGRVAGYSVIPRGDGAVLRQAGLQAGDVLLSVNNEALDPERHADLARTLAGASTITLTYRRDGQIRTATLQASTP